MNDDSRFSVSQPADDAECTAFSDILHQSLFFPPLDQYNWIEGEGRDNCRVIRLDGGVVGGFSVQRMGQFFGGQSVPCGAVRCVGTVPHVRAQGVATRMLSAMLEELHDDGVPIASLYPSTQPIYRRVGFEQAGVRTQYMQPTHGIDLRDRALEVRPAQYADKATFQQLYGLRARETNGHLDRNDWLWEVRILSERGGRPYLYLLCDGDDVQGYVIYSQRYKKDIVDGEIHIRDMVIRTPAAARRLWTFFADQRSSMQRVYWSGAAQEPLLLLLPNQDYETAENWRWLLRIVDVQRALEARGFSPHVTETLHLEVVDPILPSNQQRWLCHIEGGKAQVAPGGDGHVRLHIRGLAAIYASYLTATAAQWTGLVEGHPETLKAMDLAFAGPSPWMPDMF